MKKINGKKGLTVQSTLIGVVVLVITAGVIFLLWNNLTPFFYSTIDKEACHQSVVYRSSINFGPVQSSQIVPLNCQTEKICLSEKEDCEIFGDKKVEKVKLSSKDEEARDKVLETISNAMYDCNSMLGGGKLNFMPNNLREKNYCLICSRIALDKEAQNLEGIAYSEFYEYLGKKKNPKGISYLEYLYPGWKDSSNAEKLFENLQALSTDSEFKNLRYSDWKINLEFDNGYAVVAQMAPESYYESYIGGIATAVAIPVGTVLIATGVGAPAGVGLILGSAAVGAASGGAVFWYNHPDGKSEYSPPVVIPYDVHALNDLQCSSFELAD